MGEISADLLPEDIEKELDLELLPTNALNRDVTALAGELDFTAAEITYICSKQAPFKFLLDQWCKREGKNATLRCLQDALLEIKRPDLAQIVQETSKNLREASFNQLEKLSDLQDKRIDRRNEDCTFVSNEKNEDDEEEKNPYVYAMFYPESDEFVENVHKCLDVLRTEFGVDVHSNLTNKSYETDRQFFVFDNLHKADYVLLFCSPAVKLVDQIIVKQKTGCIPDTHKELRFAMNFIVKEIYRKKGSNSKFVPVLIDSISRNEIPGILVTSKFYRLPKEFEALARRIFKIAEVELPPLPKPELKQFLPTVVSSKRMDR